MRVERGTKMGSTVFTELLSEDFLFGLIISVINAFVVMTFMVSVRVQDASEMKKALRACGPLILVTAFLLLLLVQSVLWAAWVGSRKAKDEWPSP